MVNYISYQYADERLWAMVRNGLSNSILQIADIKSELKHGAVFAEKTVL